MKQVNWANVLTWTRLVSVVPLTIFAFFSQTTLFLVLYALAILTDAFDGTVARMQRLASARGATFDGTVDLVFAAGGLLWLYVFVPSVYVQYWPHLVVAGGAFALFFLSSYVKLGRIAMPHLLLGKLSMLLFSLFVPVAILFGVWEWMVWVVAGVVVLSRLEMTVFVLKGRVDMNAKSVFF